jgi:hypothetical protein
MSDDLETTEEDGRKPVFSQTTACVTVCYYDNDLVTVRNSKKPKGIRLRLSATEWIALLAYIREGNLDLPPKSQEWSDPPYAQHGAQVSFHRGYGVFVKRSNQTIASSLGFDELEWIVFVAAVRAGQFNMPPLPA